MKIGNIREVVKSMAEKWREPSDQENYDTHCFEFDIKELPKASLEKFYKEKFNKNLDYDQWVGIRVELDRMGNYLFERTLTVIGDAVFAIRYVDQRKVQELEGKVKELEEEKEKLTKELRKYID